MKIEFRKAKPEDTEAIKTVEEVCGLESWNLAAYRSAIADPLFEVIVATSSGKIIGFVLLRLIMICDSPHASDVTSYSEVELLNIGVLPERRKEGIASRLFASSISSLIISNNLKINLEVRISNMAAVGFYRKMGFREVGTRRHFYTKPNEDALLMTWERDKVLAVNSDSALLSDT